MPSPIIIKTTFQLRRGKLAEWVLKNPIPADGEPCFADDVNILKVGNGTSTWNELPIVNAQEFQNVILHGYYYFGDFYTDSTYQTKLEYSINNLYVDKNSNGTLYTYNGINFEQCVPLASDTVPGVMKLYNVLGINTDGTMTQKAITDELSEKTEVSVDGELILFS